MKDCSPRIVPFVKGDRFNLDQCPKNDCGLAFFTCILTQSAILAFILVKN